MNNISVNSSNFNSIIGELYGDTSDNNNLATDSVSCSYNIAIKNSQIFKRIGKTPQKMKILFILSIIETLAALVLAQKEELCKQLKKTVATYQKRIEKLKQELKKSVTMTQAEYIRIKAKLAVAKDIASDFRLNTTLRTIISNYEARIKEVEK